MYAQKPTKNPKYIILCYVNNSIFGYNLHNGNNNLNGAICSSFFIARPVESKNKQNTRNKLKLEK